MEGPQIVAALKRILNTTLHHTLSPEDKFAIGYGLDITTTICN